MVHDVLTEIERRDCFVVTSHARPDGDAVGSVLACTQLLRSMGKRADAIMRDSIPAIYRVLPFADTVVQKPVLNGRYDAAIILECDSVERTELRGFHDQFLINIDHHASGRPFANVNWIDAGACATAEMVYCLMREAGVKITPEVATCLYTGIITDTGSFGYSGTTERTFALARELVHAGADPVRTSQNVYFSNPVSKMRLLGAALSRLHKDGELTWMYVTRADMDRAGAADEDCEGLVNYALGIDGVEVAAFFRELQDDFRWRASLRSKGAVNVAEIAEMFGGGGHYCAAGCPIDGPLSVASERILAQLRIRIKSRSPQ